MYKKIMATEVERIRNIKLEVSCRTWPSRASRATNIYVYEMHLFNGSFISGYSKVDMSLNIRDFSTGNSGHPVPYRIIRYTSWGRGSYEHPAFIFQVYQHRKAITMQLSIVCGTD